MKSKHTPAEPPAHVFPRNRNTEDPRVGAFLIPSPGSTERQDRMPRRTRLQATNTGTTLPRIPTLHPQASGYLWLITCSPWAVTRRQWSAGLLESTGVYTNWNLDLAAGGGDKGAFRLHFWVLHADTRAGVRADHGVAPQRRQIPAL
jgi:hypothetical protein